MTALPNATATSLPSLPALTAGTFRAIVDASVQQMNAYGALLQDVGDADRTRLQRPR